MFSKTQIIYVIWNIFHSFKKKAIYVNNNQIIITFRKKAFYLVHFFLKTKISNIKLLNIEEFYNM